MSSAKKKSAGKSSSRSSLGDFLSPGHLQEALAAVEPLPITPVAGAVLGTAGGPQENAPSAEPQVNLSMEALGALLSQQLGPLHQLVQSQSAALGDLTSRLDRVEASVAGSAASDSGRSDRPRSENPDGSLSSQLMEEYTNTVPTMRAIPMHVLCRKVGTSMSVHTTTICTAT